jgi:hypothetical protein
MGPNRPVFRVSNLGDQPVQYSLRSGEATRSGTLARARPAGDPASTAYFLASGSFPDVEPVALQWSSGGRTGQLTGQAGEPRHCTYGLRPVVRWVDASGLPVAPPPSTTDLVTMTSSLSQLTCRNEAGALTCGPAPVASSTLPPSSFTAAPGELAVPAFAVDGRAPSYTVTAVPSDGFVPNGTGTFALEDLGSGLGQSSVDARLRPFFAGEGTRGVQVRDVVVTMRYAGAAQPGPDASTPPSAPRPSAPAPNAVGATTPSTPATSAVPTSTTDDVEGEPTPGDVAVAPPAEVRNGLNPLPRTGWSTLALAVAGAAVAVVLAWLLGDHDRRPWSLRRRPS